MILRSWQGELWMVHASFRAHSSAVFFCPVDVGASREPTRVRHLVMLVVYVWHGLIRDALVHPTTSPVQVSCGCQTRRQIRVMYPQIRCRSMKDRADSQALQKLSTIHAVT
jgi:hypothetical protein